MSGGIAGELPMTTATLPSFATLARPRWYRSVGAVAAGLAVNAVLSTATDFLLVAIGVFPPLADFGNPEAYSDLLLLLALAYRTAFGVLGCYIAARLVGRQAMAHAVSLGGIGAILGTLGAVATWDAWTHWYSVALIIVALPAGWLGGRIHQSHASRTR